MVYITQTKKLKQWMDWALRKMGSGKRNLEQFLSKAVVEKGFKKRDVVTMLDDYEVAKKIEMGVENGEKFIISLMREPDTTLDEHEREALSLK